MESRRDCEFVRHDELITVQTDFLTLSIMKNDCREMKQRLERQNAKLIEKESELTKVQSELAKLNSRIESLRKQNDVLTIETKSQNISMKCILAETAILKTKMVMLETFAGKISDEGRANISKETNAAKSMEQLLEYHQGLKKFTEKLFLDKKGVEQDLLVARAEVIELMAGKRIFSIQLANEARTKDIDRTRIQLLVEQLETSFQHEKTAVHSAQFYEDKALKFMESAQKSSQTDNSTQTHVFSIDDAQIALESKHFSNDENLMNSVGQVVLSSDPGSLNGDKVSFDSNRPNCQFPQSQQVIDVGANSLANMTSHSGTGHGVRGRQSFDGDESSQIKEAQNSPTIDQQSQPLSKRIKTMDGCEECRDIAFGLMVNNSRCHFLSFRDQLFALSWAVAL